MPKTRSQLKNETFKLDQDGLVREWLDNQENKTFSVNTALYYVAQQFGTGDYLKALARYNARITNRAADLLTKSKSDDTNNTSYQIVTDATSNLTSGSRTELESNEEQPTPNLDFLSTNQDS